MEGLTGKTMRQPRIPVTVLQKTCLAPVLHKGPGSVLPAQMSAGNLVSSRQTTTRCKSPPDSPTDTRPGLATGGQANLSAAKSQDTRFELCRSPAPQVRVYVCARVCAPAAPRQPASAPSPAAPQASCHWRWETPRDVHNRGAWWK